MLKVAVTVGIPAYNEEKNIKNLLLSILSQEEKGYFIKKIIVVSDGSTDETVKRAKEIKDERLEVISKKKRVGKSTHLNYLFRNLDTDILVLFDADVTLADRFTLQYLIQPMLEDENVGLVGGCPVQFRAKNFLEKAINVGYETYKEMRLKIKQGNNLYCCIGQILALSKTFAKQTVVPKDVMCNDTFLYLACLANKFKFMHIDEARVWYRAPKKLDDHIKQSERFAIARARLTELFGKLAKEEYKIPKKLYYIYLIKGFLRAPLHSSLLFILNSYSGLLAAKESYKFNAAWPIAWSTKLGIKPSYEN
ncbi:hypothetical protein A3A46_03485 [Candidatus Roizmanbacteria bacterium RIFCSPLOWO2_01_FULL_37_13]|uniref:Glycosyltransferase 2-like domain-containing protein n=1 Tax=Candidatus Roizmanbacteria bacterium RIFCSPHIGHO2_02_FULL_38_11 TaxID=1802039 RepID=A0A1F7GWX3_9BACT|nr:MAG: hypothetical protein A3C25_02320 [Candidatus Roizmanbacteria bacterium RIFCSPHIGHO2_02_FULL_38_11]OGK35234.1 MAG: hypothetical protein A3F58_00500 [Candidatus Roizmanbacteria bacterium RIFCSPHIGHO2_12_FULL_37_9b]OGK43189.1 MAG: hypothetical protein A3A46_03485 [Candidatus Roizmanbacteria bacterium RIFCSPLOWO2_01_FULL_37_13]